MKVEIKQLGKSEVEITGEIPVDKFNKCRAQAIKNLNKNVEISGFRKGHIPEDVLIKQLSEQRILEEAAQLALKESYPQIIKEEKLDAIGLPEINITKIAKNNPLGFKIKTAIVPEIKLPNYKEIAKTEGVKFEKNVKIIVEDKEIEDTILEIRKMRASQKQETDKDLPELNDEFVKTLGNFKDVSDFKNKLRENILLEKEMKEKEKKRLTIMDKLLEKTSMDIPQILIDVEIDKMIHQLKYDLARSELKFEEYLKNIKKTENDIRKEWAKNAEKRSKLQLLVFEIAKIEDIKPNNEEVDKQVNLIIENQKDVNPERIKAYVENVLLNEKVFQFLENQK